MAEQPVGKLRLHVDTRGPVQVVYVLPLKALGGTGHPGRRRRRLSVADLPVGMVLHGRLERPRVSDALSRSTVLSTPTR